METNPQWPQISALNIATAFPQAGMEAPQRVPESNSPRHSLAAHKCFPKGPAMLVSQPITSSHLHRLCRIAAGFFFPTCAHTHARAHTHIQNIQGHRSLTWAARVSQHQRSHCSTRSGANTEGSSAIRPSLDCRHHIPTYKTPAQSPETLQRLDAHTLAG